MSRKIPSTPPRIAPCSSSELTARPNRIAGNARIGSTNSVAVDNRPTAVSAVLAVGPSNPERLSIWNIVAPPVAAPPGSARLERVAGELRARDVEPLVGVQRDAHQEPDAHERRRLQHEDRHEPRGEHRLELGERAEHHDQARQHQVERDGGDDQHHHAHHDPAARRRVGGRRRALGGDAFGHPGVPFGP